MVQKFLKSLIAIIETSLLTDDILQAYHAVMSFLQVTDKLPVLAGLVRRQGLVERLHRDTEALVHGALQTPQLRQLAAMATASCSRWAIV
jgi:hypothetical protein